MGELTLALEPLEGMTLALRLAQGCNKRGYLPAEVVTSAVGPSPLDRLVTPALA